MRRLTQQKYIDRFREVHGDAYAYKDFPQDYNQKTDIEIICHRHGRFSQRIINHSNGMGCPDCGVEKRSETKRTNSQKKYERLLRKKYESDLDFSRSDFSVGVDSDIEVSCLKCGEEFSTTIMLLKHRGPGCPGCRSAKMREGYYANLSSKMGEKFISDAVKIHGKKYDYSKVVYKKHNEPVEIICQVHGSFFKRPVDHVNKYKLQGCPRCTAESAKSSHEERVSEFLIKNKIPFVFSYYEKNDSYLRNKPFDFFVPKHNLLIEVDGDQHRKLSWNQPPEELDKRKKIDSKKRLKAEKLGYKVLVLETNKLYISDLKKHLEKFNDYPIGQ
jgi:very-short-patch-repair endonuclease/predicted  nucleic acid-binding Zn-ribbon protein